MRIGLLLEQLHKHYVDERTFKAYIESNHAVIGFKLVSCEYYLLLVEFMRTYPRFQYSMFRYTEWRDVIFKLQIWFKDPDCERLLQQDIYSAFYWKIDEGISMDVDSDSTLNSSMTLLSNDFTTLYM